MAKPLTEAEVSALPPTLSYGQAARLMGWDCSVLSREVQAGRFPVKAIPKGKRLVLPKQGVLDLLAGRAVAA